jgi:hypothetical protein
MGSVVVTVFVVWPVRASKIGVLDVVVCETETAITARAFGADSEIASAVLLAVATTPGDTSLLWSQADRVTRRQSAISERGAALRRHCEERMGDECFDGTATRKRCQDDGRLRRQREAARESPFVTSGIRLGAPAMTTRGLGPDDFRAIAGLMDRVIASRGAEAEAVAAEVRALCEAFPLYDLAPAG